MPKRPLQIVSAVILLAFFGVLPVAMGFQSWPQAGAFVAGLIVLTALFFIGKRWLDNHA